ncbi:MAG TPA: 2-amino-4-oxopentanoate thiolase subunit OrtA [Bacillota bacterium]|nr:2-amino-4-oxopentanoate thiolase subunit OrtA [Bacillota bacterium]HOR85267.1 2-amino-4-oxopentanoate thiolase subunit OrtA [Bacillota bacterium]HPL54207.1 2-amino-4-oxopentanoate thiolase subunit OrtA [Bacillota bacterium]
MKSAKKGDWVQIHQILLKPGERAPQVPEDTKKVPLELWIKGIALHDAEVGSIVEIKTSTGRKVKGTLRTVNPRYNHDFGDFVPELLKVDMQLKEILFGGDIDE